MSNLSFSIQSQIKATVESDLEFSVPFDEAWQWLEYSRKDAAKRVLVANFVQHTDFHIIVDTTVGGRCTENIYLTQDCVKQLAMLSGTAKGKEVRLYFIECERELKAIKAAPQAPKTLIEAMEVALTALKEAEATKLLLAESESKVIEMAPKVAEWEALCDSSNLMTMQQLAKVLAIPGLGRTKLFVFLRSIKVLDSVNSPYQTYVNKGYFEQKTKINPHRGDTYLVTLVSYKGFSFIYRQLKKAGYISPDSPTPNAAALVAYSIQLEEVA